MNFLNRLLGKACAHYFSWPRTDSDGRHYQICSRCGIAYEYDWTTMRRTDHLMAATVVHPPRPAAIPGGPVPTRLPLVR
jgi:hypothetical protein